MCSYNAVNGVPTCANAWLLQTVARQSWGFDGYITSDCDAVANVVAPHHYAKTAEEAVAVTLRAGMDIDCSYFVGQHGMSAYKQGLIDDALIDARLAHLFKVRFRLQHFDPPGPLQDISIEEVCSESHASTAAEGLVQSAAMYKNDGGALPMNAAALRSVAVIGPNAKLAKAMAGYYGPGHVRRTLSSSLRRHLELPAPRQRDACARRARRAERKHKHGTYRGSARGQHGCGCACTRY